MLNAKIAFAVLLAVPLAVIAAPSTTLASSANPSNKMSPWDSTLASGRIVRQGHAR